MDERIKNIPDKIYLQVGDNVGWDVDFKELEDTGEVTWCSDKIENWDIEYIRASRLEHLVNQEVERRIAERMPSEEEIDDETIAWAAEHQCGTPFSERWIGFVKGAKWLRSCLTQKTEGGRE